MLRRETEQIRFPALLFEEIPIPDVTTGMRLQNDKLEFVGQIFTAPLPPAFMRGVPEGRGEYRTRMRKSFYLRRFALILG